MWLQVSQRKRFRFWMFLVFLLVFFTAWKTESSTDSDSQWFCEFGIGSCFCSFGFCLRLDLQNQRRFKLVVTVEVFTVIRLDRRTLEQDALKLKMLLWMKDEQKAERSRRTRTRFDSGGSGQNREDVKLWVRNLQLQKNLQERPNVSVPPAV